MTIQGKVGLQYFQSVTANLLFIDFLNTDIIIVTLICALFPEPEIIYKNTLMSLKHKLQNKHPLLS